MKKISVILLFLFTLIVTPTKANASGAGYQGYPPSITSTSYYSQANSEVLGSKNIEPKLSNIESIPKKEELDKTPSVSINTAGLLIKSKVVESIFVDEVSKEMVINTINGGRLKVAGINAESELTGLIVNNKINIKYVKFVEGKKINKIVSEKKLSKIRYIYFLLLVAGIYISFNRGIFKGRRKVKVVDGEKKISYSTRDGKDGYIPEVTFKDVAGCQEAIEDLKELADFLKDPEKFHKLGAKVPKGAILSGPPGTGKTLLARAVAGEAGCAFFSAAGSDFVEMYVGVGASRVRQLFAKAKSEKKAIIFIDEIDAVAKIRGNSVNSGNDEREGTLNALLHELDGFEKSNVILLAATNRVELLDPAILRPGRLDRKISVPNPDRKGREDILKIHMKNKPIDKDVDVELIARRTPGMSGAELASIVNEAAIEAARRNIEEIDSSCFSDAIALVAMGRARKSAVVTEKDKLITAWHEAGHTICALLHPDAPDPVSVSITPRGHAGGITWMSGSDDLYLQRKQAAAQLVVAMGGRAAEEILLDGEFTQGPSSDLHRATELAKMMVNNYGMTRRGLMVRDSDSNSHEVVEELLINALADARSLLNKNIKLVEMMVNELLLNQTLDSKEILEIRDKSKNSGNKLFKMDQKISETMKMLRKKEVPKMVEVENTIQEDEKVIKFNNFTSEILAKEKINKKIKKIIKIIAQKRKKK